MSWQLRDNLKRTCPRHGRRPPPTFSRFYSILDELDRAIGGERALAGCSGRMNWPKRGVYFFREPGENRTDTGNGPRIVRVGTHALKAGSGTTLWTRLSQHKGPPSTGAGNHRGSIFRLIVGTALIARHGYDYPTWGRGNTAKGDVRTGERALECEVSQIIGKMPFLWLAVEDDAGPQSLRGYLERNSIALLSNYNKPALDRALASPVEPVLEILNLDDVRDLGIPDLHGDCGQAAADVARHSCPCTAARPARRLRRASPPSRPANEPCRSNRGRGQCRL